jgi:hypothetical protein
MRQRRLECINHKSSEEASAPIRDCRNSTIMKHAEDNCQEDDVIIHYFSYQG